MSRDLVEQLFKLRWPRLYLDTAELIAIGRGHLQPSLVNAFLTALEEHSVVLVISHAHIQDALKPGDRDAPELLASTLERFWIRGLVDKGPWHIEPWQSGAIDVEILPWGNVRELLRASAASANLAEHDFVQTVAHAADLTYKLEQRAELEARVTSTPKERLSKDHEAILVGSANVLAIGLEPDAAAAVDWCAKTIACTLTAAERSELIKRVSPAEAAIRAMSPLFAMISHEQRLGILKMIQAGPEAAPGMWLAKRLAGNRLRNADRNPSRSDSIDLEHCAHIPYVDMITCDRQAYAALAPHLTAVTGPRTPRVFKNGQLDAVLAHVRTLPSREEYFEQALHDLGSA